MFRTKAIFHLWSAPGNPQIAMYSDGDEFIAQIRSGIEMETLVSVGYSTPNFAWDINSGVSKKAIADELDIVYARMKWPENPSSSESLVLLRDLAKAANRKYNELIE